MNRKPHIKRNVWIQAPDGLTWEKVAGPVTYAEARRIQLSWAEQGRTTGIADFRKEL